MAGLLRRLLQRKVIDPLAAREKYKEVALRNGRLLARGVAEGRNVRLAPAVTERPMSPLPRWGSCVCKESHFSDPWYGYFCQCLRDKPRFHRKQWEFLFVCVTLERYGLLASGRRGLGFGVGSEPLPSYFASLGCSIVATDMGLEEAQQRGWSSTDQHANNKADLNRYQLCPSDEFSARVSLREVDMNRIPSDLAGFDFCWSACAFEHLGSIEAGLAFVQDSLRTLKPGGVAVHTTEFNLSSNGETIEEGDTVLFRRRDFEELQRRVEAGGHRIEALDFDQGQGLLDGYIDLPPFLDNPHLRLLLERHVSTSIGVVISRG